MAEELKNPRLIEAYVRSYNSEREAARRDAVAVRARLEANVAGSKASGSATLIS